MAMLCICMVHVYLLSWLITEIYCTMAFFLKLHLKLIFFLLNSSKILTYFFRYLYFFFNFKACAVRSSPFINDHEL